MKRSDRVRVKSDPRVLAIILELTDDSTAFIAYLDEPEGEDEVELSDLEPMPIVGDVVVSEAGNGKGMITKISSHYEASVAWTGESDVKKINWDRLRSKS